MSLLIKALKQAERDHRQALELSDSKPAETTTPASTDDMVETSTPQVSETPLQLDDSLELNESSPVVSETSLTLADDAPIETPDPIEPEARTAPASIPRHADNEHHQIPSDKPGKPAPSRSAQTPEAPISIAAAKPIKRSGFKKKALAIVALLTGVGLWSAFSILEPGLPGTQQNGLPPPIENRIGASPSPILTAITDGGGQQSNDSPEPKPGPQASATEAPARAQTAAPRTQQSPGAPKSSSNDESSVGQRTDDAQRLQNESKISALHRKNAVLQSDGKSTPKTNAKKNQASTPSAPNERLILKTLTPTAPTLPPVKFVKSESFRERNKRLLNAGYDALRSGQFDDARSSYREALRLDPNLSDAWIGLASLAAQKNNKTLAAQLYKRALRINPNDRIAKTGLVTLHANANALTQESALRNILAQQGPLASIQFALGNTLASQGRWRDAQKAYFEAFAADSTQADYAFNLAVSLERIKQSKAALSYYRQALTLTSDSPAQFDTAVALDRIKSLQVLSEQVPNANR